MSSEHAFPNSPLTTAENRAVVDSRRTSHHLGDPCIHCGKAMTAVESGPCVNAEGLAAHTRNHLYWKSVLKDHEEKAERERKLFSQNIRTESIKIALLASGFDGEKISLAETFLSVSKYSNGGADRQSVLDDAIKWFADETSFSARYDLRREYFGTKNYDSWRGQRSDHSYGYGPSHGTICFSVGLRNGWTNHLFTAEEKDAAIYYLMNLPAIQQCAEKAQVA